MINQSMVETTNPSWSKQKQFQMRDRLGGPLILDPEVTITNRNNFFNSDDQDPYVDTVSNKLIQWYKAMRLDQFKIKVLFTIFPVLIILLFYAVVSRKLSVMISFSTWIISLEFMAIAVVMLCEILMKD